MKYIVILLLSIISLSAACQVSEPLVFKVEPIDTNTYTKFKPQTLTIIGWDSSAAVNGVPMLAVRTILEEVGENVRRIEYSTNFLPKASVAALISQRDKITGRITSIDMPAFMLLLATFKLKTRQ